MSDLQAPRPRPRATVGYVVAGLVGCGIIVAIYMVWPPADSAAPAVSASATATFPTAEEMQNNWPSFFSW